MCCCLISKVDDSVKMVHSMLCSDSIPKTEIIIDSIKSKKVVLKVTEACAGISATTQALKRLNINYKHIWMSENDKHCVKVLRENYGEFKLHPDFSNVDVSDLETADLFVCGFCCQSFSKFYKNRKDTGLECYNKVDGIIENIILYIQEKQPKCFILENVANFKKINKGEIFNDLLEGLQENDIYDIHHMVLDSRDFGVPQQRNRLFIVGILHSHVKCEFVNPQPYPDKVHIYDILDTKYTPCDVSKFSKTNKDIVEHLTQKYERYVELPYVCMLNQSARFTTAYNGYSTTITKQHCGTIYVSNMNRMLNMNEVYRLQGFTDDFKKHPVKTHSSHQCGNTMTVNVIMGLIESIRNASKEIFD